MTRITNEVRNTIGFRALTTAFKERKENIAKSEDQLAIECYDSVFPKKLQTLLAELPKEWVRRDKCLRFNANGWNVLLNSQTSLPVPYGHGCSILGSLGEDLAKRVQQFSQQRETIRTEYTTASNKLSGFLARFNTFNQLKEAWPEGEEFYKDLGTGRSSPSVPAVVTSEINTMLGLKT